MSEKVCKNCRWFKNRNCHSGKIVYTGSNKWGEIMPEDGIGYYDSEDYSAGCEVGPEFGCIHFTRRPEKEERKDEV